MQTETELNQISKLLRGKVTPEEAQNSDDVIMCLKNQDNPSARFVSLEKSLRNCDCTISSSAWAHIRPEHGLNKDLCENMRANTIKEAWSQIITSSTF